jgi:hypothetical protein
MKFCILRCGVWQQRMLFELFFSLLIWRYCCGIQTYENIVRLKKIFILLHSKHIILFLCHNIVTFIIFKQVNFYLSYLLIVFN